MKVFLAFTLLCIVGLSSCRKAYYCSCNNNEGDHLNYNLDGQFTKQQAKNQCNTIEVLYGGMDFVCTPEEL